MSTAPTRNKAKFRGVRIRDVPDRGGRVVMGSEKPKPHSVSLVGEERGNEE